MFNLFGKKKQKLLKESSIRIVADTLVLLSVQLGNRICKDILSTAQNSNDNASYFILLESVCMYLHYSNKSALKVFPENQIGSFLTQLCILTAEQYSSVLLDGERGTENNVLIATQLRDKYNETHAIYGSTNSLLEKNNLFTGRGLFSVYGRRMSEIMFSNLNPEIITRSIEILTVEFNGNELDEQIALIE